MSKNKSDWEFSLDLDSKIESKDKQSTLKMNTPTKRKLNLEVGPIVTNRKHMHTIIEEENCQGEEVVERYLVYRIMANLLDLAVALLLVYYKGRKVGLLIYVALYLFSVFFMRRSLGKLMLGLQLMHQDSSRLAFRSVVLRETLFKAVSIITVIGIVLPFFRQDGRGLHDMLLASKIIRK